MHRDPHPPAEKQMNSARFALVLVVLLVGSACARAAESVVIDARGSQPRVAVVGNRVAITYASGQSIMLVTSTDGGVTFSKPARVGNIPKLMVGMRSGPQLAMTNTTLVVAGIGAQEGNIMAWRSRDVGQTWTGPVVVNDRPKAAAEGLFAIAAGQGDAVWAVWLDQRDRLVKIEMSGSTDGGSTWSANSLLYQAPSGSVCECCQPTIAADTTGAMAVMWRNSIGGARDMWLCSSSDNGKTFTKPSKLGSGTWNINACPMDGGGVASAGKIIQTVWRREGTMFACTPTDAQETDLGQGMNGCVAIARKSVYRAWQRGENILLAIDGGAPSDVGSGSFPHLAVSADDKGPMFLVWQSGNEVRALRQER
ncbi:MAG: sialidase family protein [Planctomycetota bacterium]